MCFLPTLFSIFAFSHSSGLKFLTCGPTDRTTLFTFRYRIRHNQIFEKRHFEGIQDAQATPLPIVLLHGACFVDVSVNSVSLIGMIIDKKYNNLLFISNISLSPLYNYGSVYLIFIIVILEKRLYNLLPKMTHFECEKGS